jgi:uncharacterized membrane protein
MFLACLSLSSIIGFSFVLLNSEALIVITWWLSLGLIGLIFLPFASKLFPRFFDRGYLFSKTIGLTLLTLCLWLFSILKILPFDQITIFGLLLAAIGIIFIKLKGLATFRATLKTENLGKVFVYEETLFLLGLIFFAFVRGQLPDIHGTEKFMDMAFLNNLLRTKFMPPVDMWLAGETANYYYYGHYVFAFLTKLTGIPSSFTYNLAMATLFSFGFSLTFSLTANLVYLAGKSRARVIVFAGLISASLLSLGGNLHTFIYAVALPFAKNIGFYHGEVKAYFYADPRSYIGHYPPTNDKLITEYPAYSYVLGDLHAQIMDGIFVLTFLALLLASVVRVTNERSKKKLVPWFYLLPESIIMAPTLAVMWMANTWDFPIYLVIMGVSFLFRAEALTKSLLDTLKISTISLLLLSPFLITFHNPTQGFHLTRLTHLLSPLYVFQMFVVWGYQTFFLLLFVIFLFRSEPKPFRFRQFYSKLTTTDNFVFLLGLCALGLVLVSELFYQKDISSSDFYRANTVWKITLQAFVLFDVIIGYIAIRMFSFKRSKIKHYILGGIIAIVWGLAMLYPFWSLPQPYNSLRSYKGLDGAAFLKNLYPDDYQAIQWLNNNLSGQPVILEAVGESYTDFARVSAFTGLPTVLGWPVHEWYWRGSWDLPGKRTTEVQEIYEGTNLTKTQALLKKYQVEYLFLGELERQQYPQLQLAKLLSLGQTVFSSGQTLIIRVTL